MYKKTSEQIDAQAKQLSRVFVLGANHTAKGLQSIPVPGAFTKIDLFERKVEGSALFSSYLRGCRFGERLIKRRRRCNL
jgi:hypothetical protein